MILGTLFLVLRILTIAVLIHAILSWLFSLQILPMQGIAARIWTVLSQLLEPIYKPIRQHIPSPKGLDLAPMVVLFGIFLIQTVLG